MKYTQGKGAGVLLYSEVLRVFALIIQLEADSGLKIRTVWVRIPLGALCYQ